MKISADATPPSTTSAIDAQIALLSRHAAGGSEADLLRAARALGTPALTGALPLDDMARALRRIAAVDLSLGRLFEGHVNARLLIETYAAPDLRAECLERMAAGVLFGVWGADGAEPVTAEGNLLRGRKRYASGLGIVDLAVIAAKSAEGQRLFVVPADDPARHAPEEWEMSGMQASRSGGFDCNGLEGRPLGPPDIYTTEPHFVGGTWRIAAVTLGGISGLLDATAERLRARGQAEAEAQLLRLAPVIGRAIAAWPAILAAARMASGPEGAAAPDRAAARSAAARLLCEELGQDAIAAVERSIGLAMFERDDPIGHRARDLACYLRQAARDAFALRVARAVIGTPGGIGEWFDD